MSDNHAEDLVRWIRAFNCLGSEQRESIIGQAEESIGHSPTVTGPDAIDSLGRLTEFKIVAGKNLQPELKLGFEWERLDPKTAKFYRGMKFQSNHTLKSAPPAQFRPCELTSCTFSKHPHSHPRLHKPAPPTAVPDKHHWGIKDAWALNRAQRKARQEARRLERAKNPKPPQTPMQRDHAVVRFFVRGEVETAKNKTGVRPRRPKGLQRGGVFISVRFDSRTLTGDARCSFSDKFSINKGLAIAFARLLDKLDRDKRAPLGTKQRILDLVLEAHCAPFDIRGQELIITITRQTLQQAMLTQHFALTPSSTRG